MTLTQGISEWRVVDAAGAPAEDAEGLGWPIYEDAEAAEYSRERYDEDVPEGRPHRVQVRDVGPWR